MEETYCKCKRNRDIFNDIEICNMYIKWHGPTEVIECCSII